MRIKNVVKVMNFHSLLRVDASKREAESYRNVGDEITKIIKTIVYNKNLVLDKKVIMPNPNNNKLNIYIANDYGFCGNFNSQIARQIRQDKDDYKIIIGKNSLERPPFKTSAILKAKKIDDMIKNFFLEGFDAKNKQYENSKIDIAPVVHIGYFKFAIVPSYTAKYPCSNTALN